ncbi:hypothetical protein C0989_001725 [Termitomyces sp. Mn162]|nr:hypothetical protein C0989_001725 [Termitomyces sp. Mn162]
MVLSSQSCTFDPRPNYPLLITAKRYWKADSKHLNDPSALTLILTHGTGFHKEQWEPTIDELYALLDRKDSSTKVREVWSIDAPNHGDAAVLNEDILRIGYEPIFPWEEYARAIYTFLTGLGTGVDVDFSTRLLVGIGHSMGAVCLLLSLGYSSKLKFESLILCELMSMNPKFMEGPSQMLVKGAINRRDVWPSYEDAYTLLKSRPAWKVWDDRVLRIFVKDGMRPLPTAEYSDKTGVTLKCSRQQETACYRDGIGPIRAYNVLGSVARRVPIHLIYGAINDYLYVYIDLFSLEKSGDDDYNRPQAVKDDIIDNSVRGVEHLASFSRLEGAGHLVQLIWLTGSSHPYH